MLKKWIVLLCTVLVFSVNVAFATDKVNINTATQAELESLKGVGPTTASAIIEFRDTHGQFTNLEQLTQVKGVGEKKLNKLAEQLTVTEEQQ